MGIHLIFVEDDYKMKRYENYGIKAPKNNAVKISNKSTKVEK